MTTYTTTDPDLLVFAREQNGDRVLVMTNLSGEEAKVKFLGEGPSVAGMTDYFSGEEAAIPATLGPWQYKIFTRE